MRFEVFAAVKIWIVVFWVVTPCSLVGVTNVSAERIVSIFSLLPFFDFHSGYEFIFFSCFVLCFYEGTITH
jgi:hypothetical protein